MPLQTPRKDTYSLTYGFFGLMGGFIVDVSHIHNTLSRLTISAKGLAFLAKHGHFVKMSDAAIRDKSKADMLVKSLVCIQVSWMLVQTISRKIVGYPITLLEVHTLVHVGCAIGTYGLWFEKPLDVRDPVWVDTSEFEDLLALMLVRNYGFGTKTHTGDQKRPVPVKSVQYKYANGSESAYLHVYPESEKKDFATSAVREESLPPPGPPFSSTTTPTVIVHQKTTGYDYSIEPPSHDSALISLTSGQSLPCGIGPAMHVHSLSIAPHNHHHQHSSHLHISLTARDIHRWPLAAPASHRSGDPLHPDAPQPSINYFTTHPHNIFLDHKGLNAGFYAYFRSWASGGLVAALTVCTFYGAAHATAWTFAFPTATERLLWRIACVDTIAGVVSLLAVFSVAVFHREHGFRLLVQSFLMREKGAMAWLYRAVVVIGLLNFPLFVAARMFIVVETFVSLRRVQLGVYETVQWADYIPHY